MAKVFTLTETGLKDISKQLQNMTKDVAIAGSKALNKFSFAVDESAKQRVASNSSDEGFLLRSISVDIASPANLTTEVNVAVFYAAFIEFGTRKFGAQYVTGLPADWKSYAAQFKGKSGGSMDQFIKNLMGWVKRKGIPEDAVYPIARKILRDGIKAKPFLYPSVIEHLPKLTEEMNKLIKS